MATLVPIPKLGQSEETVSIVKWCKAEGDKVAKGDVLFEVETDKAVLEVESQFEGTLLKIVVPADKEVPVMSTACVLGEPGESLPPISEPAPAAKPAPAAAPAPVPAAAPPAAATVTAPKAGVAESAKSVPAPAAAPAALAAPAPGKRAVSPRARKFAADFLINLDKVSGTGPGGRVIQKDIEAYLEDSGYHQRKITPAALNVAKKEKLAMDDLESTGIGGRITLADVERGVAERPRPMSKIRQVIARRLQESKQQIPHFYVTVSVDMTALIAYRKKLKDAGYPLSVNDFVLKAAALALAEFPAVNSYTPDGRTLVWNSHVNIGMAVSVPNGLVVPVLRDADKMTLDEMHMVAGELAAKARDGKLQPEEMNGGSFSISNMGMLNVESFCPIINPGESAILGVSSALPAVVADAKRNVVVRDIMKITLSADHRVIDGALGAEFANAIRVKLEDIQLWESETGIPAV